jgi:hypothetical protein
MSAKELAVIDTMPLRVGWMERTFGLASITIDKAGVGSGRYYVKPGPHTVSCSRDLTIHATGMMDAEAGVRYSVAMFSHGFGSMAVPYLSISVAGGKPSTGATAPSQRSPARDPQ